MSVAPMSGCVSQANEYVDALPARSGICGRNDNVSLAFIFGRQPNGGSYGPRTLALADWDSPSDHLIDLAVRRFALGIGRRLSGTARSCPYPSESPMKRMPILAVACGLMATAA